MEQAEKQRFACKDDVDRAKNEQVPKSKVGHFVSWVLVSIYSARPSIRQTTTSFELISTCRRNFSKTIRLLDKIEEFYHDKPKGVFVQIVATYATNLVLRATSTKSHQPTRNPHNTWIWFRSSARQLHNLEHVVTVSQSWLKLWKRH